MRKLLYALLAIAACLLADAAARGQQLRVPERVPAGTALNLQTSGSGDATFFLIGPASASKRDVKLGEPIALRPEELRTAGRYAAILRSGGDSQSATFYVEPGQPTSVSFIARPSRVPTARPKVVAGVAFVFDDYKNLVLQPTNVSFELAVPDGPAAKRVEPTKNGIAWTELDSAKKAGAAQFTANVGSASVRRVVQQVASDPCNLRFHIQQGARQMKDTIVVETDPVRDCSGNPVPDGTIVTFTETESGSRSTVDARIKRGIARAELPNSPNAEITVASGVVAGNEMHWGGGR
jgi:hypothetical protein